MRVAFFSPLPPSKSGIADYSAALLEPLGRLAEVIPFRSAEEAFDPGAFDIALYQVGNNSWHEFVYRAALSHPGVVVLHEANLHHLIAEITIKRGDWDAYLAECEYEGGAAALEFAQRVRRLETGPDYDGLPMLRRILEHARGVVVHSAYVESAVRERGYRGPVARIPHGAWLPEASRMDYRTRLGLGPGTPLVGIFGHLKPYKRIPQALAAFRRVVRLLPDAKMILAGEPHPDLPVHQYIAALGLEDHVRVLGFTPIEDFTGWMAACDVILNLRFPSVGETSGTALRALGLGRALIVSDVGAFREFPDEICCKAPVDASEEDTLFEYLNLLLSRPETAQLLGAKARQWVAAECNWERVAGLYAEFLEHVCTGKTAPAAKADKPVESAAAAPRAVEPEYIQSWAQPEARGYLEHHLSRLERTLAMTPPGGPEDRVLEMGAYLQITPALKTRLGYGEVRGCYLGPSGKTDHRRVTSSEGEVFACDIDLFDAERDRFPYPDEYFATVLCCELIEHLSHDPMFMMAEINRVLRPGGHLVLTTPNAASLRAIAAILEGFHPGFFPAYIRPQATQGEAEARHTREYTPKEIYRLLVDSGFEVVKLETGEFRQLPKPELIWVEHLLDAYRFDKSLRGDGIYALARKTGGVRNRYPEWLYSGGE
jgi:glycosyltransferase involved in cell wall biosynthesis/SAM-dependent methyltransferase